MDTDTGTETNNLPESTNMEGNQESNEKLISRHQNKYLSPLRP
jgi:hypothetical protein